jgi:hypothetical protein
MLTSRVRSSKVIWERQELHDHLGDLTRPDRLHIGQSLRKPSSNGHPPNTQWPCLRDEMAGVLAGMGLRLSPAKTVITHIDEGLDFLGWRLQRHRKRGTSKHYVYVYPAKKALGAVTVKVKTICWQNTNQPLEELLLQLNQMLGGWTAYFRWGCSSATFRYLRAYLWKRVIGWQGRKHRHATWRALRRRYGRQVAHRRRRDPVRSGEGAHQALPLPGHEDPVTVAQHRMRT